MRRPPPTEQPCDGEDSVLAGSGRVVPQPGLPAPFFPHNGSYRANPSRRHPPALIAQPQGDDFVPPTVAENYVKALREVSCHDTCQCITGIWVALFSRCQRYRCGQANISGRYVTVPTTSRIAPNLTGLDNTWRHMFFPAMVAPTLELFCAAAGKPVDECLACRGLAPC